jgi:hypothetical protein
MLRGVATGARVGRSKPEPLQQMDVERMGR